jgi:hypothetical protein
MNKNIVIVGLILIWLVWHNAKPSVTPSTPLAGFVQQAAAGLQQSDKAAIAASFRSVAAEIQKLSDPLFKSNIARPQDAVDKVKPKLPESLASELQRYFDAQNQSEMTVYKVADWFLQIAEGLDPDSHLQNADGETTDDIETAYMQGKISGIDADPEELKKDEQEFESINQSQSDDYSQFKYSNLGRGNQAVYWNYVFRLQPQSEEPLHMKQITGDCVFAAGSTIISILNGTNTFLLKRPNQNVAEGSVVYYGFRGHAGAGSSTAKCASTYLKYGYPIRKEYQGFDLRNSIQDQKYGINAWRNPEQELAAIISETTKTPVGRIEKVSPDITEDEAMNLAIAGCVFHFGGTSIARRDGDPVSSGLTYVSPHSMCCIGYCDTPEFKKWYRETTGKELKESVWFFDNSWGSDEPYINGKWFSGWGQDTGGIYILPWSSAKKLITSSGFCYFADLTGITPQQLKWTLERK